MVDVRAKAQFLVRGLKKEDLNFANKLLLADALARETKVFAPPLPLLRNFSFDEIVAWFANSLKHAPTNQHIGLFFSGQGVDPRQLLEQLSVDNLHQKIFAEISEYWGQNILEISRDSVASVQTRNSQMLVFAVSVAMFEKWKSDHQHEMENSTLELTFAGFSLGEYAALVCSGCLSLEDGVKLVKARSLLMQRACDSLPTGMASVVCPSGVNDLLSLAESEGVEVAVFFDPNTCTVAGFLPQLERLMKSAKNLGMKVIPLKTSGAFHCSTMNSITQEFREEVLRTKFHRCPENYKVMCNVNGRPYQPDDEIGEYLVQHLTCPVFWSSTISTMLEIGVHVGFEFGPSKYLLSNFEKRKNALAARVCSQ